MDPTAAGRGRALDQHILQTLMVPLAMVVGNELDHRSSEMLFAQWNHPVETFLLDRPHKSLRVRICIRGLIRGPHHANPILFKPVGLELPILALIPGLGNVAWRSASDLR